MSTVTHTSTLEKKVGLPQPVGAQTPNVVNGKVTTHIKINDGWYDLTNWKHSHPGGALIIEQMNGNDATDAFYSLHSKDAINRLSRLPSSKTAPPHLVEPPPPTKATLAFREFRAQLEKEGWFKKNLFWDVFYTGHIYLLAICGTYLAFGGHPVIATILIGLAMQQAGWVAHDYIHARGTGSYWNALIMQTINGFSRTWWSNKHNTHHVYTNHIGIDADIENDPVFHLFFPEEKDDPFFRRMQHWYFVPVASVLYYSWRIQSIQVSFAKMDWKELIPQALNYIWLYFLGWEIALASIYLGGFLVSFIVTATHQSEEMIEPEDLGYSFVESQFSTTRDARTSDPIMEWLWGGMQYQLEHHLFPTIPKYYYSALAPRVEEFAKKNGLTYRVDTQLQIFYRNFKTLQKYAQPLEAAEKKQ